MVYTNKLVLHIPHYAWENEQLIKINYEHFKQKLYNDLMQAGVDSWYTTAAKGFYKGRGYDEELLTVFCDENVLTIVDIFVQSYIDAKYMRQEAFAYECNGVLIVVDLLENE